MRRIAIIGGGIAGLSAAFYLEKARQNGAQIGYDLFEQSSRVGGILHTERIGEFVVEAGADSFLTEKSWAHELCRELGLEHELIGSNDEQRKTYIFVDGKLRELPKGLQFIVPVTDGAKGSELFSEATRQQFARELGLKPRASDRDESAAAFVERHFGRELLERVADPMLAGIYGGESERLSARAVLPRLVEMERTRGSLLRALQDSAAKGKSSAPIFTSLRLGLEQLVTALVSRLEASKIHLNSKIEELNWYENGWSLGNGRQKYDAAILSLPTCAAAKLLARAAPELAQGLAKIRYTSSMTVALGFSAAAVAQAELPEGFGFLVPRGEKRRLLACTFVHNKFPHRVPEGGYLMRLFFGGRRDDAGGARDEAALALSDDEAVLLARTELREISGFDATPDFSRVWRWPSAMPQYEVGHLELMQEIERLMTKLPSLALAGNAYHGVGIPDCIRAGRDSAQRLLVNGASSEPLR